MLTGVTGPEELGLELELEDTGDMGEISISTGSNSQLSSSSLTGTSGNPRWPSTGVEGISMSASASSLSLSVAAYLAGSHKEGIWILGMVSTGVTEKREEGPRQGTFCSRRTEGAGIREDESGVSPDMERGTSAEAGDLRRREGTVRVGMAHLRAGRRCRGDGRRSSKRSELS